MKQALIVMLAIAATPAFAHHEVVFVTSMMPLAVAFAAIPLAAFSAWRRGRKNRAKGKQPAHL